MVRNLLLDRFKFEFHWGKKEMAMYDLVVGKGGPKLKESVDKPPSDPKNEAPGWGSGGKGPVNDSDGYPNIPENCNGCMSINGAGKARYHANKGSMKTLAEMLGNQMGMPVHDATELTGLYDVTLSWTSGSGIEKRADGDADAGLPMEAAVQQQLGLKLVSKRGPVDVIVMDKAERTPAEN
jgi:uncharacterized protein (TIGR03435 family)